jgi:hypothetical protein
MNEMCSYSSIGGYHPGGNHYGKPPPTKPKRVKCPQCGRKMWAAIRVCNDGCCVIYCVPPHKIKGWWKKGKKKKTTRKKRYHK